MAKKNIDDTLIDLDVEDIDDACETDDSAQDTDLEADGIESLDDEAEDDLEEDEEDYTEQKGSGFNVIHIILLVAALAIIAAIVFMITKWNKGIASDYDPNEDNAEFNVETNDYIQPLSTTDVEGKLQDGSIVILTLGNSPFSDGGADNNLCKALGDKMGATVINGSIPGSTLSQSSDSLSEEMPSDGVSLYQVTDALTTGDFNRVLGYGEQLGQDAYKAAQSLQDIDMTKIDCIVIMYDLTDYREGRPAVNIYEKDRVTTVSGALYASVKMLRDAYPYIRIVVMSTPACGFTADDYYVDGDQIDMGGGTLVDYMGQEISSCASAGVSFVDLYYGAINVDNRDEYLYDDYHINDEGAQVIADRFAELIQLSD